MSSMLEVSLVKLQCHPQRKRELADDDEDDEDDDDDDKDHIKVQ